MKVSSHGHLRKLLTAKGICNGYWKNLVINTSFDRVISYKNEDCNGHEYLLLPYFLCVCPCVCVCLYVYTCVCVYTHIYTYTCVYIHRYMCVCVCVCVYWLTDANSRLIGKDSDARKDWGRKEKGRTENKMAGWHHWFNGHEFEQILGDSGEQGNLAPCRPWGGRVGRDWATVQCVCVCHNYLCFPFCYSLIT